MGLHVVVRAAWSQKIKEEIRYQFDQERIEIGRGSGADVRLPHPTVSESHATIRVQDDNPVIVDVDSTNGTRVNGALITPNRPKILKDGDMIDIGVYTLTLHTAVVVTEQISAEHTAALARRLIRKRLDPLTSHIDPPRLVVLNGQQAGEQFEINSTVPSRMILGRDVNCHFVLRDGDVSFEHMEVIKDVDGLLVRNLDMKNNILINNKSIGETRLKNGMQITLGTITIRFEDPADQSLQAMSSEPDLPMSRLSEPMPAAKEDQPDKPSTDDQYTHSVEVAPIPKRRMGRRRSTTNADIVIYILAVMIMALSVAGLVILLRAG